MNRRAYLAAAGTTFAGLTAGCVEVVPPTPGGLTNPGFERGLLGWKADRDLPIDPNTGQPVWTSLSVSEQRSSEGDRSLALSIDGRQDDGTFWVQQRVDLRDASRVSGDVFSEQESFNTITKVAVYAGPDPDRPLLEGDFDTSRPVEDHAGWKTYTYPVNPVERGLVAVGISVVWETEVTRLLDNVVLA
jgi:hypothetical protein